MSATDHNQEPEAGTIPTPAAENGGTDEPDVAAQQETATKRSVLVTVSNFVCAALAYATSVR